MNKDGFCDECGLSQRVYDDALESTRLRAENAKLRDYVQMIADCPEPKDWIDTRNFLMMAIGKAHRVLGQFPNAHIPQGSVKDEI